MAYEVRTPVYEGAFDLLLHLIVREQVDLYQVSLSGIVDAFLVEMERLAATGEPGGRSLEVTTEFLVIAATLVELKTRRLLPGVDDPEAEEELALLEERDLLLARLLECKTFRDAGEALARLSAAACRSRPRRAGLEDRFVALVPDLLAGVGPEDLRRAVLRAVQPKPVPRVDLDHVAPIRASVEDAVQELAATLPDLRRTSFRNLTRAITGRLEVIVRFLAVLELFKQGMVDIDQAETFGELVIIWTGQADDAPLNVTVTSAETEADVEPRRGPELAHHG